MTQIQLEKLTTHMETIELDGFWWVEGKKITAAGKLRYSHELGIKLSLIGHLSEEYNKEHTFIYGITSKGKKITLFNCNYTRFETSSPGFTTEEYVANFLFEGEHFQKIEDLKFKKISVEFYNSNKWLQFKDGFKQKNLNQKIILTLGPSLNYNVKVKNIEVGLDIFYNVNNNYQVRRTVTEQKSHFYIELNRRAKFESIFDYYIHLKNLLILCQQIPIAPARIALRTKKQGLKDSKVIYFFYPEKSEASLLLDENDYLPRKLIGGKYFQDNFGKLVSNWFLKKERLDYIIENFLNLYYSNPFISDRFLVNIRMLESLYREFINIENTNRKRYKAMLLLFRRYITREIKTRSSDVWAKKNLNYRNKLTHNNRINKSKALQIKDLDKITYENHLIILCFLLDQLSISKKEIKETILSNFQKE